MDLGRRSFPTAVGWFSLAQRSHECSRVPGAAQREAISVFTRVFDALWRNGALQAPISGLPEIGAHMRKSGKPDLRGSLRSVAVPDQRCTAPLRYALHRVRDATASDAFGVLFTFKQPISFPRRVFAPGVCDFASLTTNEGWAERRETFGCVQSTRAACHDAACQALARRLASHDAANCWWK